VPGRLLLSAYCLLPPDVCGIRHRQTAGQSPAGIVM